MNPLYTLVFFLNGIINTDCSDGMCLVKSSTLSPIQAASQAVADDAANLTIANKAKTDAQTALDKATADAKSIAAKLVTDRASYNTLLDNLSNPNYVPPKTKIVQIVELTSNGCKYCDTDSMIKDYQSSGINIIIDNTKFTTNATPTYVMTVDGKEVQRVVGRLDKEMLLKWFGDISLWAKNQN